MAKSIESLFSDLVTVIRDNKRHQDYKRVVELAKDYRAYMTGEGLEDKLIQFNRREDTQLFGQRKTLTILITQCIVGRLINPERKVAGARPVINHYGYPTNKKADEKKKLDELVKGFYGGRGIDLYQKDVFMNVYDSDPNAFLLFLISDFGDQLENEITYGKEITSENAIMFEFIDNELQYLVTSDTIKYIDVTSAKDKPVFKSGTAYSIFGSNEQIVFTQIHPEAIKGVFQEGVLIEIAEGSGAQAVNITEDIVSSDTVYYYKVSNSLLFEVRFGVHGSGRVPAFRVGNIPDVVTHGRTVVNGWHNALPYLKKTVKSVSELDISESLHVFPQAIQYLPRCQGATQGGVLQGCNNGTVPGGGTCSECKGTGYLETHKSGQDFISMGMPLNKEDMFDLKNLKVYIDLPIDIVKWLDEHIDKLEQKSITSVYGSDLYTQDRISDTATATMVNMQAYYDALNPLSRQDSFSRKFIIKQIAIYNDIADELIVEHSYGSNLKMESEADLIIRIERSRAAGASDYVIAQYNRDLTELVYADQPQVLKEIDVKSKFNPFDGKDSGTILSLMAQNLVPQKDKVLFSNFNTIFSELVEEASAKDEAFYDLTFKEQKVRIDKKVQAIIDDLTAEVPPLQVNPFEMNGGQADQTGAEVDDRLGKVPLAAQQISLAITRMKDAGFVDSANKLKKKFDEIIQEIDLTA